MNPIGMIKDTVIEMILSLVRLVVILHAQLVMDHCLIIVYFAPLIKLIIRVNVKMIVMQTNSNSMKQL